MKTFFSRNVKMELDPTIFLRGNEKFLNWGSDSNMTKKKETQLQQNQERFAEILANEYLIKILELSPTKQQQDLILLWLDKYDEIHGIENREIQECMLRMFAFIESAREEGFWNNQNKSEGD